MVNVLGMINMKLFFYFRAFILAFLIIFLNVSQASSKSGRGDLQFSDFVVDAFINYIKGNTTHSPHKFAVSIDGMGYMYYYCESGNTCSGGDSLILKECSKNSNGEECFMFASKRTIKWKNGINPGKGKASKISRKWTKDEIKNKLSELGFY